MRRMAKYDKGLHSAVGGVEKRLMFLRLYAGLRQAELANELGATHSAITRIERGLLRASLEAMSRVAIALGCKPGILIEQTRTA